MGRSITKIAGTGSTSGSGSFSKRQNAIDPQHWLQVVVFDPSQRSTTCTAEDLGGAESTCLLPGLIVKFPKAPKLRFFRHFDMVTHVDRSGVVVYEHPNLFSAAIV